MTGTVSRSQSIVGFRPMGRPVDDFYPTPDTAVAALLGKEVFYQPIWEPACGTGNISIVLESQGCKVVSTDLIDRGYGTPGVDFLKTGRLLAPNIVTNPPFNLAKQFVHHAVVDLQADKVCLLLKLSFLEGVGRRNLFESHPPANIYVFSKRLQLTRNGMDYRNRGMIAFAWFVWVKGYQGSPMVGWI